MNHESKFYLSTENIEYIRSMSNCQSRALNCLLWSFLENYWDYRKAGHKLLLTQTYRGADHLFCFSTVVSSKNKDEISYEKLCKFADKYGFKSITELVKQAIHFEQVQKLIEK